MDYTYNDIAKMIDHSLLQQTLTDEQLEAGCRLALEYDVASVCIKPYYLKRCAEILAGSTIKASTTIGFPHGGHRTSIKLAEAEAALADGGQELDMVVNIGKVKSGDWDYVRADIKAVNDATVAGGQIVKVIFENCFLTDEEKIKLCEICGELNVAFVKTSTGYGEGGATIADLKLMRKYSPRRYTSKPPAASAISTSCSKSARSVCRASAPAAPKKCSTNAAADLCSDKLPRCQLIGKLYLYKNWQLVANCLTSRCLRTTATRPCGTRRRPGTGLIREIAFRTALGKGAGIRLPALWHMNCSSEIPVRGDHSTGKEIKWNWV